MAHVGHVGAWNPEVQANVLFSGPSVPLIGHLVGMTLPNKGIFQHQDPAASWMGPTSGRHVQRLLGGTAGGSPAWAGPLVMEKPCATALRG